MREEDTFVARTGELLSKRLDQPLLAVNGGVNGYGTYQEMAYYRYYGRPVDADVVVVVFFPGNDFRDNMVSTRNGSSINPVYLHERRRFNRHEEHLLRGPGGRALTDPLSGDALPRPGRSWVGELERRFLLGRLLGARYATLKGRLTGDLSLIDLSHRYYYYEIGYYQRRDDGYFSTARELTFECLDRLRQAVEWDGAEMVVVLLPSPYQVAPVLWGEALEKLKVAEEDLGPLDFHYPNRLVEAFCAERDLSYLDLTAAFSASAQPQDMFLTIVGDGHLSAAGHRLVATEIALFLEGNTTALRDPAREVYWEVRRLLREQRWSPAQDLLDRGRGDASGPMMHTAQGDLHSRRGAWDLAVPAYRRSLAIDLEFLPAWEGLATALGEAGDASAALVARQEALKLQPTWWPYHLELERNYLASGLHSQAEAAARFVDELFSARREVRGSWWAEHITRGALLMSRGRVGEAEKEFKRAIRFIPDDPVAYYNLGWVYQQTGRSELARDQYREILRIEPEFSPARQRLAELR